MKALISLPDRPLRSTAIERSLWALTRSQIHPTKSQRTGIAKMVYADDKLIEQIVERGTAPLGTTSSNGWAAEVSQNLVGDFLATLAPLSAAATLIGQGLPVRLNSAKQMKLPAREGAPSTTVNWVGEGQPIPVRSYDLNDDCVLSPKKYGFIIGISRETAKRANGESVVRQLIREDAAATLDAAYFSADAGDTEVHAGLLNGLSAIIGYGGGDRLAMETDLTALSDAVSAAGSGQLAFVVSPTRANRIKIKAPDLNRELTFLPSLAVADTTVIAVDPLSLAHGFGDDFDLDVSEDAVVHMDDDPSPIVDGATASPVRSFWQTDSIAMRMLADVAFAPRRPNAVAWVSGATW